MKNIYFIVYKRHLSVKSALQNRLRWLRHGCPRLIANSAPRWQSREETYGAEQRTDGGDEPRVAGGGPAEADAAEPCVRVHVGLVAGAHAHHARRLRSHDSLPPYLYTELSELKLF